MTVAVARPDTANHRPTALATLGKRVALAASSGLALTMAAPAAMAAPADTPTPQTAPQALVATDLSPTVVVPADAVWTIEAAEVEAERPAPEPTVREASTASRSSDRTAVAAEAAPAPTSASAAAVLEIARRYIGVPYVYGGSTPAGFDCSGFTQYVFAQVGISLPRSSAAQSGVGVRVSAAEAQPGDLIWWPGHIGIYTGNGQHIAARQPGTPLTEGPIYGANPVFIRVL